MKHSNPKHQKGVSYAKVIWFILIFSFIVTFFMDGDKFVVNHENVDAAGDFLEDLVTNCCVVDLEKADD